MGSTCIYFSPLYESLKIYSFLTLACCCFCCFFHKAAVDNCAIIIVIVSTGFKQSLNCRTGFGYMYFKVACYVSSELIYVWTYSWFSFKLISLPFTHLELLYGVNRNVPIIAVQFGDLFSLVSTTTKLWDILWINCEQARLIYLKVQVGCPIVWPNWMSLR